MTENELYTKTEAFFKKWSGKNDDFDGAYPNECVDTGKRFMHEVCGIQNPPATITGWADGWWSKRDEIPAIRSRFNYVYNKDSLKKGDIVLFRPAHVAIYDGKGRVFGQNQGGGHEPNDFRSIGNFPGFLGALRLKTDKSVEPDYSNIGSAYTKCARDVIEGVYSNGHETRANNIYAKVRAEVNKICLTNKYSGGYISDIANDVINGLHGNGHDVRKESIYNKVKFEVNRLLKYGG